MLRAIVTVWFFNGVCEAQATLTTVDLVEQSLLEGLDAGS